MVKHLLAPLGQVKEKKALEEMGAEMEEWEGCTRGGRSKRSQRVVFMKDPRTKP